MRNIHADYLNPHPKNSMNNYSNSNSNTNNNEETPILCLHCSSPSLLTDYSSGDTVCTSCGVVHDSHLRIATAEWKDYSNDADLCKNLPSQSRSGLVANDETKYVGGLEPTTVSRSAFGGNWGAGAGSTGSVGLSVYNGRLFKTQKKVEKMLEKMEMERAKERTMARGILKKRRMEKLNRQKKKRMKLEDGGHDDGIVKEEPGEDDGEHLDNKELTELANEGSRTPLLGEKWSLNRAILLCGDSEEQAQDDIDGNNGASNRHGRMLEQQRKELSARLEPPEKRASRDVYTAYQIMKDASSRLALPNLVLIEASNVMCQYAFKRNGFHVRGIARQTKTYSQPKEGEEGESSDKSSNKDDANAYNNKLMQMGALSSALLYIWAKKLGHSRPLVSVCDAFHYPQDYTNDKHDTKEQQPLVKPKHCSKAMKELKIDFTNLFLKSSSFMPTPVQSTQTSTTTTNSPSPPPPPSLSAPSAHIQETLNLIPHLTSSLSLPPCTISTIRGLVSHVRREQVEQGIGTGKNPVILIKASMYLICSAGGTMQRLAKQAVDHASTAQRQQLQQTSKTHADDDDTKTKKKKSAAGEGGMAFDVLSSFPIHHNSSNTADTTTIDKDVDTLQGWYAWTKQPHWKRDLSACMGTTKATTGGVSKRQVTEYYKKFMFPRREILLDIAHQSLIHGDGDGIDVDKEGRYLTNLKTASPLMVLEKV